VLAQAEIEQEPSTSPNPIPGSAVESQGFYVTKIKVTCSTFFRTKQFNPITQPFEGKELTVDQLKEIADAIKQLYLNKGYLNSRATIPEQTITDGIVEIRIIEGSVVDVNIERTEKSPRRLRDSYVDGFGIRL
jgi:hemolysin activation/secretion protein